MTRRVAAAALAGLVLAGVASATATDTAPTVFDFNPASTPAPPADATLHVVQADGVKNSLVLDTFGGGQQGAFLCRTSRGTGTAPTALLSNDLMCTVQAWGYDGSSYGPRPAGSVAIRAADTFTTTSHPTWFKVEVTPRGKTINILAMFITPEGHWGHAAAESGGSAPTLSGCGSGASVVGDDNGGRVTIGNQLVTACTVVFGSEWQRTNGAAVVPGCIVNNETSRVIVRAVPTSSQLRLVGALRAHDRVVFDCRQFQN